MTSAFGEGCSEVLPRVEVTGFASRDDDSVSAVETSGGAIEVGEQVVVAPGPWAARFWSLLGSPTRSTSDPVAADVAGPSDVDVLEPARGRDHGRPADLFATADGRAPPVIHLDTDAPLYTDDGDLVTDELWGIYFKRDRHGVQGGASPLVVDDDVELDPYPRRPTSIRRSRTCGARRSRTR